MDQGLDHSDEIRARFRSSAGAALSGEASSCAGISGSDGRSATSAKPTTKWHDHLGDPTVADAICERILHNSHRLILKGPSRRKEESAKD